MKTQRKKPRCVRIVSCSRSRPANFERRCAEVLGELEDQGYEVETIPGDGLVLFVGRLRTETHEPSEATVHVLEPVFRSATNNPKQEIEPIVAGLIHGMTPVLLQQIAREVDEMALGAEGSYEPQPGDTFLPHILMRKVSSILRTKAEGLLQ